MSKSAHVDETFLLPYIMSGEDWRALEYALARFLVHCGWTDIQHVGQTGDKGADLLATRLNSKTGSNETYLIQSKAVSGSNYVQTSAIDQAVQGQSVYGTNIAVIATNGGFTSAANKRKDELNKEGFDVRLWNGAFLEGLLDRQPAYPPTKNDLRSYQQKIADKVLHNVKSGARKSLFIVATGLGKTVIASHVADILLKDSNFKKILALCHSADLAQQLQVEFGKQLPKNIPTFLFMDGNAPSYQNGVSIGLYQSLLGHLNSLDPDMFDLIIVDEAHHALASSFTTCIEYLRPKHLIGMTATPWRGDGVSIEKIFGEPIERVSLIDGMKMGYLARVDYRLKSDSINWKEIPKLSKKSLTIKDLNKRLFMPQRDEAVIADMLKLCEEVKSPRIAIFSPSKLHAADFANKLSASGIPTASASIDDKVERRKLLLDFSSGKLKAITAVDVLNEGINVPDVNVLVFLRATHSRRIFVQQLGRGLRLAPGKTSVIVLDFVTDIRRLAAVKAMDNEAKKDAKLGDIEKVYLEDGVVTFDNEKMEKFVDVWVNDVAGLEDSTDQEKLKFPDPEVFQ